VRIHLGSCGRTVSISFLHKFDHILYRSQCTGSLVSPSTSIRHYLSEATFFFCFSKMSNTLPL
jgi:hypothetical protein